MLPSARPRPEHRAPAGFRQRAQNGGSPFPPPRRLGGARLAQHALAREHGAPFDPAVGRLGRHVVPTPGGEDRLRVCGGAVRPAPPRGRASARVHPRGGGRRESLTGLVRLPPGSEGPRPDTRRQRCADGTRPERRGGLPRRARQGVRERWGDRLRRGRVTPAQSFGVQVGAGHEERARRWRARLTPRTPGSHVIRRTPLADPRRATRPPRRSLPAVSPPRPAVSPPSGDADRAQRRGAHLRVRVSEERHEVVGRA